MSADFYAGLAVYEHFRDITNPTAFTPVPADWYVVLTDVRGSTQAIQAGRYKEVNLIGAASIIALLNLDRQSELPFIFGGDGATVLIPPTLLDAARPALLATQALARAEFDLELRVGIVPVADLLAARQELRVARFRLSEHYEQAMFTGSGLAYVEQLVKNPATAERYALHSGDLLPSADYSGLECRWQDVPSRYGETVTLLVTATTGNSTSDSAIYRDVLTRIEAIYGDPDHYRPIAIDTLRPSFKLRNLRPETRIRVQAGWLKRQRYLWLIWVQNLLLKIFVRYNIKTGNVLWRQYIDLLIATTDYRKYDDTLRMIIAGKAEQRAMLLDYLEERYQAGMLAYGVHISNRALVTCVVFERMGRQVHFVDGADGGYALAAKELKARLRQTLRLV